MHFWVCATCQWTMAVPEAELETAEFICKQCDEGTPDPDGVAAGAWLNEHVGSTPGNTLTLRKTEDGVERVDD